jgi:nucleoid DNA-binding protein
VAKTPAVKKAPPKVPDKLTGASLVGYLAEKNGLARKEAKQVMEDIFELVAAGVMRGERVTVGKMGKIFIKVRPVSRRSVRSFWRPSKACTSTMNRPKNRTWTASSGYSTTRSTASR